MDKARKLPFGIVWIRSRLSDLILHGNNTRYYLNGSRGHYGSTGLLLSLKPDQCSTELDLFKSNA